MLLWLNRRRSRARILFVVILIALAVDLIATMACRAYLAKDVNRRPTLVYTAIAVPYADRPPAFERTRQALEHAIALYQNRPAELLCLGGNRPKAPSGACESASAHLIAAGVPKNVIRCEGRSYDTRTNLEELAAMARKGGHERIVIVAYPAHQPRVRYHLQRILPNVQVVLSAPTNTDTFATFWFALHHELVAWLLTLGLTDDGYAELMRLLRIGPTSGDLEDPPAFPR